MTPAEMEKWAGEFVDLLNQLDLESVRAIAIAMNAYPHHGDTSKKGIGHSIWSRICELERKSDRLDGVRQALRYVRTEVGEA